jgi:hypothetical protein
LRRSRAEALARIAAASGTGRAAIDTDDYTAFVTAYGGHDVRETQWLRTLADLQELRWTAFVADKADTNPDAAAEVSHRLACLRGEIPRPWKWAAF